MRRIIFTTVFCLSAICYVWADVSPYVSKVLEYTPAPGQFTNTLTSAYREGYTEKQVLEYANTLITQRPKSGLLSLGAYGGYIIVGFDHTIVNVPGEYDFKVYGNAFYSAQPVLQDRPGGSCEPGIVMVSQDVNGNGLPDDEWYELAGSEYNSPATVHNYEITYVRPEQADEDIFWRDNQGNTGYVYRNEFHRQNSYFPEWISAESLIFRGSRLANSAYNEGSNENPYWVLYSFPWGYADNHPSNDDKSNFKIDWAVDKNGNPVYLSGIDFVKIYTGQVQSAGWLGETSTEFSDIEDLHPGAIETGVSVEKEKIFVCSPFSEQLIITIADDCRIILYNMSGQLIFSRDLQSGSHSIPAGDILPGCYLLHIQKDGQMQSVYKVFKN